MANLIAKTYGEALFESAVEISKAELLFEEAKVLLEVVNRDGEIIRFMKHPGIAKEEKLEIGKRVFDKSFSKEFAGFLSVLILKDRFGQIEAILEEFIQRMKEYQKIGAAYISTANPLTKMQKKMVERRLLETTDYETFEMNYLVDESLIGGMVIRIGDRVADASVKNSLRRMR